MNKLTIHLAEGRLEFRPREILRGMAEWQLDREPVAVEVRLCWFVQILRVSEVRRVQTLRYDKPLANDGRKFDFRLPDSPYSYAGSLSMLSWAVELVALPERNFTQVFFTMAPRGEVLELHKLIEQNAT